MRKPVLLVVIPAVLAFGQAAANPIPEAKIGLYGDAGATMDYVYDTGPGVLDVYVVLNLVYDFEAIGVRFSAPKPPCFQATHIGDWWDWHPYAGNSQTGVYVNLVFCQGGQIVIGKISYAVEGLTEDCCWYDVEAYPPASGPEVELCNYGLGWVFEPGYPVLINPDEHFCGTPVEQSTWGQIKGLYNE
jgi:hypothetical protein